MPNGTGVSRVIIVILNPWSPDTILDNCLKLLNRLCIVSVQCFNPARHAMNATTEPRSALNDVKATPSSTP
eukprot:m.413123 g.413123  ORF g.413123 m.413123 type:complete len:71 (-) comp21262_c0_seq11:832-1044(-)